MALGADEIEALATATATATATAFQSLRAETATVNAVAVKLPLFWSGNPEVWFKQVESVFATRKITVQKTQFDYVIQALDNSTADRVQAVILTPSETPYDTLKAALIDAFGKTQAQKDQDILNINGLGEKKPSELLQHMNNLNADPKTLFKALFLAQLPPEVRQILALSDKTEIKDLAKEADRIMEVSQLSNSQVNSTSGFRPARCTTFQGQENVPPFRGRETAHPVDNKQLVDRDQHLQPVDGCQHLRLSDGCQHLRTPNGYQQLRTPDGCQH